MITVLAKLKLKCLIRIIHLFILDKSLIFTYLDLLEVILQFITEYEVIRIKYSNQKRYSSP